MMEFLAEAQLNLMQMLSGICVALAILVMIAKALTKKRRKVLMFLELTAMMLITFDRLAYVYSGDVSATGYIMVRVSNFIVFFMTSGMVLAFNLYISDLLKNEGKMEVLPRRLITVDIMSAIGMLLIVISQFTGLIYTFDELNIYHRAPGFLLSYIIPVIAPFIQLSVILQYKEKFNRIIFISLILYIVIPITAALIQIFAYGLSLVNIAMVFVALFLYIFAYFDINESVERAHKAELSGLKEEQKSIRRLFDQTAKALADAIEIRDEYSAGHSERVAKTARMIAKKAGKSDDECDEIYYSALLHDVGMLGMPDDHIGLAGKPGEEYNEVLMNRPVIGEKILSEITEYPSLKTAALYGYEKYDGTGYPEGLKGKDIPDIARIVSVADAYDNMLSKKQYRDPLPEPIIREEFIKESGIKYDPEYSHIMVTLIDADTNIRLSDGRYKTAPIEESVIECSDYRSSASKGIEVTSNEIVITFKCEPLITDQEEKESATILLFDSYDAGVHDNANSIEAYNYIEYGEIWFDGHIISTSARSMESEDSGEGSDGDYEIVAGRYEDHMKLKLTGPVHSETVTVALTDSTKSSYISLTGEHCRISGIRIRETGKIMEEGDIKRIADRISYIDRLESDVPNIQIDRNHSAFTPGIRIMSDTKIEFHTMSLPTADLVWHCPHIILFSSDDGKVGGNNYHEYEVIKLNGENNGSNDYAESRFVMKKEEFEGWSAWKEKNRSGMECELVLTKRGDRITLITENAGIYIHETLNVLDGAENVYISITGDQCALTDIRIR